MATLDQLAEALIKADAAGDTQGAAILAQAYADLKNSAPVDSGQGRLSSFASNVGRGALSIGPNVVGGLGYLTGSDTLVEGAESMEQGINEALPVNPIYADEFSQKAGNVIGQGITTLATAGAGGVAGKVLGGAKYISAGAQTGALAPAFLAGSREGGLAAQHYGLKGGAAYARTVGGGLTELGTEFLGRGTELATVRKLLGETFDLSAGKFIKAVGTEAGEEVAAQVLGNVQTSALAPEGVQTPGAFEGSLEAGALGAVGGGFFGGVNALTGKPETPQVPVSIESGESVLPVMEGELEEDISPLQVADVGSPVVSGLVDDAVAKAAAAPQDNAVTNAVIAALSEPVRPDPFAEVKKQAQLAAEELRRAAARSSRNTDLFPDQTDFAGKLVNPANLANYTQRDGYGVAEYANPQTGVTDVFLAAQGDTDYIAYIRVYDEQGNPTNRFTSKLERRSDAPGLTKKMLSDLQARLPENHQYTEDVSVSTDGLRFIRGQLNQGYEVVTDVQGKPVTQDVAISGESRVNDLPIAVDPNGQFENISVSTRADFEKVRGVIGKMLEGFGVGLNESNVRWENGTVFIDMPVLQKKGTPANQVTTTPSEEVTPPIPEAVGPVPEAQTQPEVAPPITPDNVPQETPPPSSEAIPEPTPPAVVEATTPADEIQVEETSGPAPVESLPADEAPAGQAQEGAALRQGKGQEVAAPQPTQKVRFRREGNLITGTYEGQDSLGRHIVNVNGKKEYSASRPQVADDAIESISVGRKKGSKIQTSRATSKRPPGLGVPVVEKIVAQFRKQLPNAPNIRIITRSDLDTAEEFQPLRTILQSMSEEGAEPNLEGWLNRETREVFLVSDNLADPQRAREVLIHEIIGHGGVLSVATLAEMRRIAAIIRRVNPDLVAQVEAAYKDIPNATEGDQVGEILAAFAEAYASADPANLPQGWARAWQDLKRIIASIIRKLGGDPNAFDDADLHWFYTNAVRQVYERGLSAEDVSPPSPNPQLSLGKGASAQDAEYLSAVESGDMEKAQKMVDDAAKAAGYNKYFRAGDSEEVGVKEWASFTPNDQTANAYTDNPGFGGAVVRGIFVAPNNILNADVRTGRGMQKIADSIGWGEQEWIIDGWQYPWEESKKVKQAIESAGFDAVEYIDDFPEGAQTIVFTGNLTNNQTEPADPVTRDAQGNIIPLSQRFNAESSNINFSLDRSTAINFPGTPEALADNQRQLEAGVSNAVETRDRFAAADKRNRMYIPTTEKGFIDDTDAFLDTLPTEEGAQAVLDNNVPGILKMGQDGRYRVLVANSLRRVSTAIDLATDPYEQARLQALGHELSLRYQQVGTSDGRALKSGATAGSLLAPIAAVLAYQNLIIEKADRIIKTRFNGGAEGAAATVDELAKSSGKRGGREVADALSGEDATELDAAETLRNKAQESAERIFNSLVKPTEPGVAPKPDPVREVYNEHLKQQMTEEVFVSRLTELGVAKQTAETLFTTAADEIRGRETTRRLKGEAKEKRTKEIAEQRASRLIYRTEERLRQGSKDLNKAPDGDTINKAFRDQVKEASEWPVFRDRLAKLNVGEEVAQRLYRTAEREAEDLQAVREIKDQQKAQERRDKILAKDSPKLVEMLNALKAKLYPGMNWRSIFEDLPDQQLARQKEIYDRLRLDERIQGLTTEEAVALTNELDKAWQRQRRKVFMKELERQGVLGEKTEADKEKVKKVLPKLLRAINLGVFNSDMFRQSIATEYGFRPLTAQQSKDLRALAQEAWLQPEGILRNKKLGAVLDSLQKATGASISELVNNYWVASVLTGFATQFDTFMSAANGLGNNLIQAGTLLAKGAGKDAFKVHAQWWAGLKQGAAESLQILLEGDYSVLKRFNKDLNKAMEGESNFRPVPLGESLWKNGNWWQKYGMAPVMMWTGRLMSAADHINNTATTYGAMAAARALYPELYGGKTAFTTEEQAAARAEALQDVTGGKEPTTREERNTVSVRTREILLGLLEQPQQEEASFIGDQAAYQNDPIGMFGSFYNALNAGMGTLERALEGLGESPAVKSAYLRAVLAGLAGGLRGLSGTKFMRFGFNFGNDITQYIPGTYLLQKLAPVYGTDMSRSQQELLLGKNVFGLMAASTIAAMFLGKDDEEEGWHIEGNWSGLSNDVKNQLRSAGKEPLTVWRRREDGSLQRVSYRSWPTGGIFVAVGSMNDQRRYQPAKWAESGIAGNLLRAATNGALHVKDLTAMQGLAEIFGASSFNTDPENDFMERMLKLPSKFVGGFIPTALKDVDAWEDPRSFRPETLLGEFGRNVPIARRYVSEERPLLNLLGEPVKLDRTPWRRVYTESKKGEAYDILGKLLSRGLSLPEPSSKRIVVVGGKKNTIEGLGPKAEWEFARILGEKYKAYLLQDGDTLMAMPTDRAQRRIRSRAQAMGDQAEMEMLRKLKP